MTRADPNAPIETPRRGGMLRDRQPSFHALLRHAWRRSSFYRDLYSAAGIREADLKDVTPGDLPLINKKLLRDNFDAAVTDPRLREKDLERWIQAHRDPAANYRGAFIVVHSSGSSGNVGIFVCSRADWQLAASAMAHRLPPPANYPAGKTRVAFYLASHGNFGGVSIAARMPRSIYDPLILSVLDSHQEIARKLNDFQPHQLHGYASSVHDLALLSMRGTLSISPKRIVVGGDKLTGAMESDIQRVWDVPLYEFYSASESHYIAVRQAGEDEMAVLDDLNILEVLDDGDRPVSENQEGRVVLTNLYNYTLPIIRYELGDYVSLGKEDAASPHATIKDIRGRAQQGLPVMLRNGTQDKIQPHVLSSFYVPGLEKFQYISTRLDRFQILYVSGENLDAAIRTEFQRILDLKGAAKTAFEVRRVARISSDPHTGKYKLIEIRHAAIADSIGVNDEFNPGCDRAPGEQDLPPPVSVWEVCGRQGDNETNHRDRRLVDVPPEQQALRARCFHSSGTSMEFKKGETEVSLPERFETMVRLYSDRIAVKAGDQAVTYAELNAMANRTARAILAELGTAREPIGLLLDNGPALFAAMLGVLKAGKFFVAVDPALPEARIATLLADCDATLVVTHRHHAASFAQGALRRPVLDLDSIDPSIPATNLCLPVSADDLALAFHTGGSSGLPKAVLWTHRVLLHHLMVTTHAFHACAEDRISLLASGTSVAVTNGLFALLVGAALLPFDVRNEGVARLASWLSRERISICWFSPPLFRALGDALTGKDKFADLRLIRLAGDAAYQPDIDLYKRHFPSHCILVNALSSSEAGLLSIYYLDHTSELSGIEVPVGYPVPDKEILLLDDEGKGVGFNEVGEIVVKSRYLSSGYWHRPDLTDAKFRVHPEDREERLYFTGDLALMRPDGCLIYKGREDFRVKIRGYGVEFAEVEKVLLEHEAIGEVVVAAPKNESGEARLVAYFTSPRRPRPSVAELRGFARTNLPEYMVPSAFVILEEMPLMPNGKVDRRALPEPGPARPEISETFVAPRTPLEEALGGIWRQLLGIEPVGIHDNFFDLGGHSLLATQFISRVREALHLELPLRALFEDPTIAGLATQIAQMRAEEALPEDAADILVELESLSDEEAARQVARERRK